MYDIDGLDFTGARGTKQINMKKRDNLPNLSAHISTTAAGKATINLNLFFFVCPLCLTVRFQAIIGAMITHNHNCTVLLS